MATRDEILSDPRSGAKPLRGSDPGPSRKAAPARSERVVEGTVVEPRAPAAPRKAGTSRRSVSPRTAYRKTSNAATSVTAQAPRGAKHALTAAFVTGIVLVAIRMVADYEVNADGTVKGKIGHPAGQYGPLPVLAGLIATFFLLSLFAKAGAVAARVSVIFGWIIILVLAMKSMTEFETAAGTFAGFGKGTVAPAGSWQTSGPAAGLPVPTSTTGTGSSATGTSGSSNPLSTAIANTVPGGNETYLPPTSVANVEHDIKAGFGQALEQMFPGIEDAIKNNTLSQFFKGLGNDIKKLFGL